MLRILFLNLLLFTQIPCNIKLNLSCHINALKTKHSVLFQESLKNICSYIAYYYYLRSNCYSYLCSIASLFVTCDHFFCKKLRTLYPILYMTSRLSVI